MVRKSSNAVNKGLMLTLTLQLAILIWWFISAHKWFKGPKVNVEHLMLGREEQAVIEGKDVGDGDRSSGSHDGMPVPAGKQGGDMKPNGL